MIRITGQCDVVVSSFPPSEGKHPKLPKAVIFVLRLLSLRGGRLSWYPAINVNKENRSQIDGEREIQEPKQNFGYKTGPLVALSDPVELAVAIQFRIEILDLFQDELVSERFHTDGSNICLLRSRRL